MSVNVLEQATCHHPANVVRTVLAHRNAVAVCEPAHSVL
jgi:hypothetical protein